MKDQDRKVRVILARRYRFLRETGGASRKTARANVVMFAATYLESVR